MKRLIKSLSVILSEQEDRYVELAFVERSDDVLMYIAIVARSSTAETITRDMRVINRLLDKHASQQAGQL